VAQLKNVQNGLTITKSFLQQTRTVSSTLLKGKDPIQPSDHQIALCCATFGECNQKDIGEIPKDPTARDCYEVEITAKCNWSVQGRQSFWLRRTKETR